MADAGLFIGYGIPVRGRERQAVRVFGEALEYFARLQQQGEIESFETVFLNPHGGDLNGFTLLRGDPDKLSSIRTSDEFVMRLSVRADLITEGFGVSGPEPQVGGAARRWNTVDWMLAADTVRKEPDGSLNRVVIGRIASTAFIVASALFLVSDLLFPGSYSKASTLMVGGLTLVAGFASWWIPWEHLPRSTVLWMVPFALFAVDLGYVYAVRNGFNYSVTFVIIFVLVGLTQPRWTSLQLAPLLVVAYVLPLLITSDHMSTSGLGSAIYVVPVCLLLGEATAWGMSRLAEASSEIAEGEESIRQLFDEAPIGISRMGVDGRILEVNRAFGEIVGAAPEDLVGLDILDLTHPDDVAETTSLIAGLLAGEIDRYQFEKRYIHADGRLVWVSVNGSVVRDANGRPLFLIGQIEDIAERRTLRDELALHAVTDPLTGLPNRSLFMEHLGSALPRAEAAGRHVALMFLDLDRFKLVNDGIGHDAGDRLLKRVGQRLGGALRSGDVLARFGGDEFTVLCEVAGEDEVMDVVQRLRQALSTPVVEPDFEQFVSLSIGVALSTSESMAPAVLLRCADVAMYQAKGLGPGRYVIYEDRDDGKAGHNLRTSNELHRAILGSQLVLHYQPLVNVDDLRVVGTEALVRWQHPERGLLPPGGVRRAGRGVRADGAARRLGPARGLPSGRPVDGGPGGGRCRRPDPGHVGQHLAPAAVRAGIR